jgi:uncharacterized repeat protein (TIGR01451 family)
MSTWFQNLISPRRRPRTARHQTRKNFRPTLMALEVREVPSAAIQVVKLTNGTDNNLTTGPELAPGAAITWTYVVKNVSTAGERVHLQFLYDDNGTPGNTADDFNPQMGPPAPGVPNPGDTISIPGGLILEAPGQAGDTLTFTATGTAKDLNGGVYENTAFVQGIEVTPTGTGATVTDTDIDHYHNPPRADLSVTKTDGKTTYTAGTSTTYTIVVRNAGPNNVTGAALADVLPPGAAASGNSWAFVAGSATGGASVAGATSGTGALNTTVNLPAGSSLTFTQTVQFAAAATGSQTNTVTVTPPAGTTDPTPGNNTATDTDTPATPPAGTGSTATIGFWHNKNGQALISSVTKMSLGNWLATNFPNLYGPGTGANNLTGKTGAQVAAYDLSLFNGGSNGKKYNQLLGVALAIYFNDPALGGALGQAYGFKGQNTGNALYKITPGEAAAAADLGLTVGQSYTIRSILDAANAKAVNGVLPANQLSDIAGLFADINEKFDIG